MHPHDTLSDTDWDLLTAVPFAVLLLVGYADGGLAPAERRAFTAIVDEMGTGARTSDGPLAREVMWRISRDPGQLMARWDAQVAAGMPFYEVLSAARALLDGMPQQADALAFKEAMVHLGQEVARARPILGRRTSAEEARSIRFIADQLGLPDHAGIPGGPATDRTTAAA